MVERASSPPALSSRGGEGEDSGFFEVPGVQSVKPVG